MAELSGLGGANNVANLFQLVEHDAKKLSQDQNKMLGDELKSPRDVNKLTRDVQVLARDAEALLHDTAKLNRLLNGGQGGGGDMAPPGPDTSASMAVTLAEIRSVSGKASELLNKVLVTQLQQEGNELLQQQLAARQASKDSLLSAAGDLRSQGSDILKGAVQSFAITVAVSSVSMGLTVAGGLSSLKGLGQEAKETGASMNRVDALSEQTKGIREDLKALRAAKITIGAHRGVSEEQQVAKNLSKIENVATEALQAVKQSSSKYSHLGKTLSDAAGNLSKLGESASNFASSMGQYDQKMDEAQEKTDEASATQADSLVDAAKDARQKLSDTVDKVIEFIKDIQDAKADMMASVVHKGA